MHFGVAALLAATALVAACQSVEAAENGESSQLMAKLHRVARSPQLGELAERARDLANSAREAAQQHVAERVASAREHMEQVKDIVSTVQSGVSDPGSVVSGSLPSSISSMANNS